MHAFRPVPCEPRTGCSAGWDTAENQNCLVSSEPNVLRVEQARHHSERRPINAQVCSFRKTLRTVQLNYDT